MKSSTNVPLPILHQRKQYEGHNTVWYLKSHINKSRNFLKLEIERLFEAIDQKCYNVLFFRKVIKDCRGGREVKYCPVQHGLAPTKHRAAVTIVV